jgi:hypothetical protein
MRLAVSAIAFCGTIGARFWLHPRVAEAARLNLATLTKPSAVPPTVLHFPPEQVRLRGRCS